MPDPSSWDLLDESFAAIGSWVDEDNNGGVSSQQTFDGEETLECRCDTPGSQVYARRSLDIGTYPDDFTVKVRAYFSTIGTVANTAFARLELYDAAKGYLFVFASDNLHVYDDAAYDDTGIAVAQDAWHVWQFLIDGSAQTCDIYLDDVLQASDVPIEYDGAFTDGLTKIAQYSYNNAGLANVDYIKIATGLYRPGYTPQVVMF